MGLAASQVVRPGSESTLSTYGMGGLMDSEMKTSTCMPTGPVLGVRMTCPTLLGLTGEACAGLTPAPIDTTTMASAQTTAATPARARILIACFPGELVYQRIPTLACLGQYSNMAVLTLQVRL